MSVISGTGIASWNATPGPSAIGGAASVAARLVVIGGLPGTGKSTLASRLGEALDAVVLRSDEVRRQVGGLSPAARPARSFGDGMYSPEVTELTYKELLARARAALVAGRNVVVDASWHDPAWREAARRLASEVSADLAELRCALPLEVIAERVTGSAATPATVSAGTLALVRLLAASEHPWPSAIAVDTAPEPEEVTQSVLRILKAG